MYVSFGGCGYAVSLPFLYCHVCLNEITIGLTVTDGRFTVTWEVWWSWSYLVISVKLK